MNDHVVGRVERLALPLVGEDFAVGSIRAVAHDASTDLFAANEAIIRIEAASVGLIGRFAKGAGEGDVLVPAKLSIIWDVAPNQFLGNAIPGWAFGPDRPGLQAEDRSALRNEIVETGIEADQPSPRIEQSSEPQRFPRVGGRAEWSGHEGGGEGFEKFAARAGAAQRRLGGARMHGNSSRRRREESNTKIV